MNEGAPGCTGVQPENPEGAGVESSSDSAEVERVPDKRTVRGAVQYKVKWKGWNNKYNCWREVDDLQCHELIDRYESAYLGLSVPEVVADGRV